MKSGPAAADDVDRLARRHLGALARTSRPTGSEAAARARAYCAKELRALGFDVVERPFHYSALPGAYGATLGASAALLAVCASALAAAQGSAALSLAILVVAALALAIGGRWLTRRGVLSLPMLRRAGVNLEATRKTAGQRGGPELWLVAHIDSKSQPVPLLARAGGVILLALSWLGATVLAALELALIAPQGGALWIAIVGVAIVGAIPVAASVVGDRSDGAVDNASGVATVLGAAAFVPNLAGVVITDAEELALAGARAWCRDTKAETRTAVNCDGVDDVGTLTLMYTGRRPRRLAASFHTAAERLGETLRIIPLIPGLLVDGVAFADAGWEVVTVSRGTLATLRRIHTRADDLRAVGGDGVARAARVVALAVESLLRARQDNRQEV